MDPYIGEIRAFGFNFAPSGWAICAGQLLPISQNTALFSLLGTQYGGDGRSNFALPNLQGNIPISQGQGPGLGVYSVGDRGGSAAVALLGQQVPSHTHTLPVAAANGKQPAPSPTMYLGATGSRGEGVNVYATPAGQSSSSVQMLASAVGPAGGAQPHNNLAPYLAVNYCIALQGVFPPRS